jgi:hypothetical protein
MLFRASHGGPQADGVSLSEEDRTGVTFSKPTFNTVSFISQHVDYTGTLYSNLRDLEGKDTLAFELIQNADDVSSANWIRFDIRDDALVVQNDGQFTDCGDVASPECSLESTRGVKCDFHRFRKIAGRGKRREENTTGAFGIGFISVYQITDKPQLRSGHRHWTLHPDASDPNRRIEQEMLSQKIQGTEFYLPWAQDEDSTLRKALDMTGVSPNYPDDLAEHLCESLPASLLFLRNLSEIEIFRNGAPLLTVRRTVNDDITRITQETEDETTEATYLTRTRRFDERAKRLLSRRGTNNQEKKDAEVRVSIRLDRTFEDQWTGRYYAYLPTRHSTDLPFHIQADFFPSSDRRRIVFDGEFRSEWNRLAVRQAHAVFAESLPRLRSVLSPSNLWSILDGVYKAGHGSEEMAKHCWETVKSKIQDRKYVYTASGEWKRADKTYLFPKDNPLTDSARKALGLPTRHPKLRDHYNLLRSIGAKNLTFSTLVNRIESTDLRDGIEFKAAPEWVRHEESYNAVCRLLQLKYSSLAGKKTESRNRLRQLPLAKTVDGNLKAFSKVKRSHAETLDPLKSLASDVAFLTPSPTPEAQSLIDKADLVDQLNIPDVFDILRGLPETTLAQQWEQPSSPLVRILRRIMERIGELKSAKRETIKNELRQLPIWPSGDGYHGLDHVVIPGGYEDPLGLSRVLGPNAVKAVGRELEENLGVQRLSFERYVTEHLPHTFEEQDIDRETRGLLVVSLSREIGKLQAIDGAPEALSSCGIVLCKDGSYRPPDEVYFEKEEVQTLLGGDAAYVSKDLPHEAARNLYELIGVASTPRPEDILRHVKQLVNTPPSESTIQQIKDVIHYLGQNYTDQLTTLDDLKRISWLPAEGDDESWHKPVNVYAPDNKHLFASQAEFVDVRNRSVARPVLDFLGVEKNPKIKQIVEHLLHCAREETPPNQPERIYKTLSSEIEQNPSNAKRQVQRLKDRKTLYIQGVGFCKPSHVFRSKHPFGSFRYQLGSITHDYNKFLDTIGVKQDYGSGDAVSVLLDIAEEHGDSREITEDVRAVVQCCWEVCQELGLQERHLRKLREKKVVLSTEENLIQPEKAFFDDHPDLPSRIEEFLRDNLVHPDPDAISALDKAGVRSVRNVLTTRLAEAPEATRHQNRTARIKDRLPLIQRILTERSGHEDPLSAASIRDIETFRSHHLSVITEATVLGERITSEPKTVTAFLDDATNRLYVADTNGQPWFAVSREIALHLAPVREPASLASDLTHALQPPSLREAEERLDALGFAHIKEHQHEPVRGQAPVSLEKNNEDEEDKSNEVDGQPGNEVDGDDSETQHSSDDTRPESPAQPSHETERDSTNSGSSPGVGSEGSNNTTSNSGSASTSSTQNGAGQSRSSRGNKRVRQDSSSGNRDSEQRLTKRSSGSKVENEQNDSESPTPSSEETLEDEKQASHADDSSEDNGKLPSDDPPVHSRRKSKLRSYVVSTENEEELRNTGTTRQGQSLNSSNQETINRSGIEFVLEREKEEGRVPEEQDHYNPGYDIQSRDENGNTLRFIEVKSTNGPWDGFGVGLSSTQFEMAQEKKDMYWLYVVEHAASDDPKLHRIQHPELPPLERTL